MKKILTIILLAGLFLLNNPANAATTQKASACKKAKCSHGVNGEVSLKSIGAGALSLVIWPGIGQLMNDDKNSEKVLTHAVIGLFPPFRIWSCYDGVVDRKGGVWGNRI